MKQRNDPSTKPYYKCLHCPRFRKLCGGLPTRDMTMIEWCEMVSDVMDFFHLSNAYVAKESDNSEKTIERIRARNIDKDMMRGTTRRVEIVVFGPVGDHACYLDHDPTAATERINRLLAEIEFWKKENDRKAKIIDKYLD